MLSGRDRELPALIAWEKPDSLTELAALAGSNKSNLSWTLKMMSRLTMSNSGGRYRVGVDVGGTFTDVFSFDGATGRFEIAKVASRPVLGEYATAHMPHARPRLAVAGFACSADGPALHGAPPELGRHTTEILADLGYGPEDISALEREGVVQLPIVGRFAGESCPDAIGDRR